MARQGKLKTGVHQSLAHDSAGKHVSGGALYTDDLPEPPGLLYAAFGMSTRAHARITAVDLAPVRKAPGVVAVMTAADVPGDNNCAPVMHDDPIFADGLVEYVGQSIFAVAAETVEQARRAARLAVIEYEDLPAILTTEAAMAAKSFVLPAHMMKRGEPRKAISKAKHRLKGRIKVGGQDQFYLEGHIAMAVPGEDRDVTVFSSTQNPSEVQHLVAEALGLSNNAVTLEIRRMGGAFGGKETQPALYACIAALLADKTGRPVKARVDRDDDMVMTGKRHDFVIDYDVGFDDKGRIKGIEFVQAARCGMSADLSGAIADRAMFHADNAYYLPAARIVSHRCKTNTVSNTAFRGFGGPQGMVGIEQVIDEIARDLGKDPLDIRRANLYGDKGRDVTPYHMTVEDNILPKLLDDLEASSDYRVRRKEIDAFNATSPVLKRGIALTPVKFGISFTTSHLNQAGALIHVYTDGSVHLNHGGTEMGQGLFVKVAQVVAEEFQIDLDRIKITATNTGKVPNTSATAASSGTDMNGMAARNAARTIKERLIAFAAEAFDCKKAEVVFQNNKVRAGKKTLSFTDLVRAAYIGRVSLSATGFYSTPKIHYDRKKAAGRPFYYFAYGAAVSEAVIDTLTGEYRFPRVDILHDVGQSLNPAIDIGQIEGGFLQGLGWLTMEELYWNADGSFATHAPSTYKIPTASDWPEEFDVRIFDRGRNKEPTIHRSKAVGEPPLMLAISGFLAIKDALAAACGHQISPPLDTPATPEAVLMTLEAMRTQLGGAGSTLREAAE
ncbi:MAG TPA: xanthine dehydrogenase molybdopterin binding subunit [Alphaproteobacteria bacterium]|nr:xanthine dehydrogenase molybdopterin binding subunit [Alphaproteobacteria bacterium]